MDVFPNSLSSNIFGHDSTPSPSFRPKLAPARTGKGPSVVYCKKSKNEDAFKEKKRAVVDYDTGTHLVSVQIDGLRKSDLPKRNRLRVEGDRFQEDWPLSEVVANVMKLNHWEDIDGVLNRWAGRFARKNFPILIRIMSSLGETTVTIISLSDHFKMA